MQNYRKIIHIDMDCFYAAVERLDNNNLAGKAIVVGHDSDRGVVATASYEARRYGVHSAQSIRMAKRLCPNLLIIEPRFERYKEISNKIHNIFYRYTDLIEPISLDEAFLDVTQNKKGIELASDIAKEIKAAIHDEFGLTASAGVSYCKLLAKIASDYNKPDGLCIIHPDNAIAFLDKLKVEDLWLVGHKTALELHSLGIFKVRQLRNQSLSTLSRLFGKRGQLFYDYARGIDNRLDKSDFSGHTLTLKVKYADFTQVTRSLTCANPLTSKDTILPLAKVLLQKVEINASHPIRLMGLGVSCCDDKPQNKLLSKPKQEEPQLPFAEY